MRGGGEARGMRWKELEEGGRKRGRGDNDVREICGNNAGTGEKRERGRNRRKGREREREDKKPTALTPLFPSLISLLRERNATRRCSLLSGIIVQGRGGKVNKTGRKGGSRTVQVLRLQRLWRQGLPLHITLQYEIDGAHGGFSVGKEMHGWLAGHCSGKTKRAGFLGKRTSWKGHWLGAGGMEEEGLVGRRNSCECRRVQLSC